MKTDRIVNFLDKDCPKRIVPIDRMVDHVIGFIRSLLTPHFDALLMNMWRKSAGVLDTTRFSGLINEITIHIADKSPADCNGRRKGCLTCIDMPWCLPFYRLLESCYRPINLMLLSSELCVLLVTSLILSKCQSLLCV
ncbi:unnamed protein product [Cercopithifilaria johnstoni]|uniref:Uncharacterized protein n=1 Tax=Cercopithifilaria johnstoni TaxID=2874296 RepID=A0A8J2PYI7_9BILA|nr:unnamed protein product [Cercopithifilaria johnstoni]